MIILYLSGFFNTLFYFALTTLFRYVYSRGMKKARGMKSGFPVFLSARCGKNPGSPMDIGYRLNRPSPIRPKGSVRSSGETEIE